MSTRILFKTSGPAQIQFCDYLEPERILVYCNKMDEFACEVGPKVEAELTGVNRTVGLQMIREFRSKLANLKLPHVLESMTVPKLKEVVDDVSKTARVLLAIKNGEKLTDMAHEAYMDDFESRNPSGADSAPPAKRARN
jgi:hypothetical protein